MQKKLQILTTTRKMRRRAFRTRSEVYFRVLGPREAIEDKLSFVSRIYEPQHPESWRGCTIVGFLRGFAREAVRDLRAARAVVLPIGRSSRYIAPRERSFAQMLPGDVGDILGIDEDGSPVWVQP